VRCLGFEDKETILQEGGGQVRERVGEGGGRREGKAGEKLG